MDKNGENRNFYIRVKGRITGPFPLLKLKAMAVSGKLEASDMYSPDKVHWKELWSLFPSVYPEIIAQGIPEEKEENKSERNDLRPAPPSISLPGPEKKESVSVFIPVEETREEYNALQLFLQEFFAVMALVWDFPSLLQENAKRWKKCLLYALLWNIILGIGMVLGFGRAGSITFHWIFSPLKVAGFLLVLFGICCLCGWMMEGRKPGRGAPGKRGEEEKMRIAGEWQTAGAALFMDYGVITCSLLALLHAVKRGALPGWIILFVINGIVLCCTAIFFDVCLRKFQNVKVNWSFLTAVPVNIIFLTLLWFFVRMM